MAAHSAVIDSGDDPAVIKGMPEVRKRRMPPGHIPFRRIKIPEQWKKDMTEVERCVSDAFASCTYPSLEKKERLRSAVLDVFTETRTMKESSIYYSVPFTTVQTYFHKSCKLVEGAIPRDSKMNVLQNEVDFSSGFRRFKLNRSRLGDIVSRLNSANFAAVAKENFSPVTVDAELKGSVKRKPKIVRHFVETVEPSEDLPTGRLLPNDESEFRFPLATFTSDQMAMLAELASSFAPVLDPGNSLSTETSTNEELNVVPDWCREELVNYIVSVSEVGDDTRSRLKMAINEVYSGKLTIQDACRIYNLGYGYVLNYYEAFQMTLRKQARFILSVLSGETTDERCGDEENASAANDSVMQDSEEIAKKRKHSSEKTGESSIAVRKRFKVAEAAAATLPHSSGKKLTAGKEGGGRRYKDKEKYGPPLDPADTERIRAIEEGIVEVCKPSTYNDSQRKRLHMAVSMVVRGESPVSVASSKANLPPSTIQLYAQRARTALGTILPPPAASLRRSLLAGGFSNSAVTKNVEYQSDAGKDSTLQAKVKDAATTSSGESQKAAGASDAGLEFDTEEKDRAGSRSRQETELPGAMSEQAVQMLANVDFKAVLSMELKCNREELLRKVDAILRNFRYQGDRAVMRDALLGIFLEGKTVDEVCQLYKLKSQSVGAFMALTKVYCESKKQMTQKGGNDEVTETNKQEEDAYKEKPATNVPEESASAIAPTELQPPRHFKEEVAQLGEHSAKSQEEGSSDSGSREVGDAAVDIMVLHSEAVRGSEELLIKNIIAYLIQQQYRRSRASQEKMRMCLENVLLDGLQVKETLAMINGPSEHVLQAYISRCRDSKRCITKEYPMFVSECSRVMGDIDFSSLLSDKLDVSPVSTPSPSRTLRRVKKITRPPESGSGIKLDGIAYLKAIFRDNLLKPLTAYVGKLDAANFPIETTLITGLAKVVLSCVPSQFRIGIAEESLVEWADEYRDKHPEFDR